MKNILKVSAILSLLIVLSCGSVKVSTDHDRKVDFTKFETFGFTAVSDKLPANDLVKDRIFNAIRDNLLGKGLTESENPDLLIDLGLQTKNKKEYSTNNYGLNGFYGRRWRIGTGVSKSNTKEIVYVEGTLVINILDATKEKEKLAWRGSGSGVINDKAITEKQLTKTINKILVNFPPKKKK